jgi:hypothetical protein
LTEREEQMREAFEQALAMYLALPNEALGRVVVHFGSNGGTLKPAIEASLPSAVGGPQISRPPARIRMPSNHR